MRGSCPTMKNRAYFLAAVEGVAAQGLAVQGVVMAAAQVAAGLLVAGFPVALVAAGLLVPGRPVALVVLAPAFLGALDQEVECPVQAAYQPRSRPT